MKIGYFPGCSLHATAKEFDESLRAIAKALDIELDEVKDWACCGATSAHATNHLLSIALPARTLMLAEKQKHDKVLAPCAACYSRLATAHHEIARKPKLAKRVNDALNTEFHNTVGVLSIAEFLRDLAPSIKEKTTKPLASLKVACYYGCLLVRPPEVSTFDDTEAPSSLEDIVKATGATPVKWNRALDCCGGGFSLSRTDSVLRLGREILDDAKQAGANAIVVACPMCQNNLDMRQAAMARESSFDLPIIFVSQLVGLALGLDDVTLGMQRHFVSTQSVLDLSSKALPAHKEGQA